MAGIKGNKDSNEPQSFKLRPIEISDSDTIAQWYQQIEDVSIFDRQVPLPLNQVDVKTTITSMVNDQKKSKCSWFVAEDQEGFAVGMTGLEGISMLHGNAIIPLFIAAPWRRKGIGVRMACMMIDLAFKQLRLQRVATMYRSDNISSNILLERLGFKQEGLARQGWFSQGEYHDVVNVGLLKDEWAAVRNKIQEGLSHRVVVQLGPRPTEMWSWPSQ